MKQNNGEGVPFERIRRITGYLVGTMEKWNDAKRHEEKDRVCSARDATVDAKGAITPRHGRLKAGRRSVRMRL